MLAVASEHLVAMVPLLATLLSGAAGFVIITRSLRAVLRQMEAARQAGQTFELTISLTKIRFSVGARDEEDSEERRPDARSS